MNTGANEEQPLAPRIDRQQRSGFNHWDLP